MREVAGRLELAALNSELATAYLKDAEDELSTVVQRLEKCLALIEELQQGESLSESGKRPDMNHSSEGS
jgi:hypothetical protein